MNKEWFLVWLIGVLAGHKEGEDEPAGLPPGGSTCWLGGVGSRALGESIALVFNSELIHYFKRP